MTRPVASLLVFIAGWAVVSIALLLYVADFFSAWGGTIASIEAYDEDLSIVRALIVDGEDSDVVELPIASVDGLDLPIDRRAITPRQLKPGLPTLHKERFGFAFEITPADGAVRTDATTRPTLLGLPLLFFFVGLIVRNMMVSGSPFSIQPRGIDLPAAQVPPGRTAEPPGSTGKRASRGRKGPPPPKRRRGGGRRR